MKAGVGEAAPLEVDLPDGGRLLIGFADADSQVLFSGEIVAALLRREGSERDAADVIEAEARELGLRVSASPSPSDGALIGRR